MRWLALLFLSLLVGLPAMAEDKPGAAPPVDFSGSLRAGYWSSNRQLDDTVAYTPLSLWLKVAVKPGGGWYMRGEGWVMDERPFQRGTRVLSDLREGFVGWRDDKLDFTFGRRVISWGRADRINPTDVLTSRNYTRLFTEDESQKQGGTVATASYAFGDLMVTLLWLPEFRANVYPIPPVYGLSFRQGADRFSADQFAARIEQSGKNFDWSLSYFRGLNRDPGARVDDLSATGIAVQSVYNRVQVAGADFASTLGAFGTRGEIAYTQTTQSSDAVFNPHSFVKAVVGIDRTVAGSLNVNVQYVFQYVFSYSDPGQDPDPRIARIAIKTALINNQRIRTQHGPALRLGYMTLNDTLDLEVSGLAFLSDGGFVVRPRATYAINDHLKLIGGADVFQGSQDSYFGQLKRNTVIFSELRYSF